MLTKACALSQPQGLLGTNSEFRKKCVAPAASRGLRLFPDAPPDAPRYELPILAGREPGASDLQTTRGAERAAELSAAVDPFILRRTNALLSAHLPPKVCALSFRFFLAPPDATRLPSQVIQIVCCPLSTMQVRRC